MKKMIRLATAGAVLAAAASLNTVAFAADATGTATATILTAMSVNQTAQLNFGTVAVNGAGTVVINPDGTYACNNVVCGGAQAAGAFLVTGAVNSSFSVSIPSTPVTLTSGGNTMTLTALTPSSPTGTIGATGTTFNVGGTLNVGATQAAGVYNGSYTVTVLYN